MIKINHAPNALRPMRGILQPEFLTVLDKVSDLFGDQSPVGSIQWIQLGHGDLVQRQFSHASDMMISHRVYDGFTLAESETITYPFPLDHITSEYDDLLVIKFKGQGGGTSAQ